MKELSIVQDVVTVADLIELLEQLPEYAVLHDKNALPATQVFIRHYEAPHQDEWFQIGLAHVKVPAKAESKYPECPYNHPKGTRCPSCAKWPYPKGGSIDYKEPVA